jgi:hypothetical protein
MSIRLITPSSFEPVTVTEVRQTCKIDLTGDAGYDAAVNEDLSTMISAFRQVGEHIAGRSFVLQTFELTLDEIPYEGIKLHHPASLIVSFKYVSALTNSEVTLATNQYYLDNANDFETSWVLPAQGIDFPDTAEVANALKVQYTAGYANQASVPNCIKLWLKTAVKYGYNGGCDGNGELPRDWNAPLLEAVKVYD